jgi:hypothetical protein
VLSGTTGPYRTFVTTAANVFFEPKVQIFCAAAKVGFEEADWLATEASART